MNIQRFIIPATIAAAFHAAMLLHGRVPVTTSPTVVVNPHPKSDQKPETKLVEIPLPTDPMDDPVDKVTTLAKGVELPSGDEIFPDKPLSDFRVDIDRTPSNKVKIPTTIIGNLGDPTGIPGGERTRGPNFQSVKFLDKEPRATVRMSPAYPTAMKNDGIEGVVTVEFDVDVKGRVVSARVRQSTNRVFEEPTLRAVMNWRFEPGLNQGRPVPFRMVIPVNFKLGDER